MKTTRLLKRRFFLKKKTTLFIAFILIMNLNIYAQHKPDGINPVIANPSVWDFIKYGNTPVSMFTGTVNMSIPIYTYKDNDFELPVSISYASNGFIPNVQAGSLGLGWHLNAGGTIIREVKGLPDECRENETVNGKQVLMNGYYHYHKKLNEAGTPTPPASILNRVNGMYFYDDTYTAIGTQKYEMHPDIFRFNFNGHRGTFMMSDGKILVETESGPHGEYKIDLSKIRNSDTPNSYYSEITITTGEGYKYVFGGANPPDERTYLTSSYSYTSGQMISGQDNSSNVRHSWSLISITAPNGRTITFEYGDMEHNGSARQGGYEFIGTANGYNTFNGTFWGNSVIGSGFNYIADSFQSYVSVIRQLKRIIIDGKFSIEFNYAERISYMYETCILPTLESEPLLSLKHLASIVVKDNINSSAAEIKKAVLHYHPHLHNGLPVSKLLLQKVDITGEGEYTMDYYNKVDDIRVNGIGSSYFARHGTRRIDHWGYYNGPTERTYFEYDYGALTTSDSDRAPDVRGSMMGMLGKITYPTKGFTVFEYESHDADRVVERNASTDYLPGIKEYNKYGKKVGGVRIKKIYDFSIPDNGGDINNFDIRDFDESAYTCREFIYKDSQGNSSGIVTQYPTYEISGINYNYKLSKNDIESRVKYVGSYKSKSNMFASSLEGSHIEYNRVLEKKDDGSYIEYTFVDYRELPDDYNLINSAPYSRLSLDLDIQFTTPAYIERYFRPVVSFASQRGKLKSKSLYSNSGECVYSENYEYDYNTPLPFSASAISIAPLPLPGMRTPVMYEARRYIGHYLLKSKTEKSHFGNKTVETHTEYTYNAYGQPKVSRTLYPGGDVSTKYTTYFHETQSTPGWTGGNSTEENDMVSHNIVSSPKSVIYTNIPYVSHLNPVEREQVTGAARYVYGKFSATHPVYKMKELKLAQGIPFSINDSFSGSGPLKMEETFLYDKYGNVTEHKNANGICTVYIWGYKYLYPIAEIVNCTYPQLTAKISAATLNSIATKQFPSAADWTLINNLRRSLSTSHITTFKYKLLTGVEEIADPAGRITYYQYDPFGRLTEVRDHDGKILERYEYNYAQPN